MREKVISAQEIDLLTFFGVKPEMPEDSPWPYTDALFCISRGDQELSCSIAPAYRDVRILLSKSGAVIFELSSTGVEDVKYLKDGDRKTLEVVFSEVHSLFLKIDPEISVSQDFKRS